MALGHQIARGLPATNVSCRNCPGRTGQVPFASKKFKINRCSEKGVPIHPILDFSEFLNRHRASEKEIFRPEIEPCDHISLGRVVIVSGSNGVSVNAKRDMITRLNL